jgi:hypothetical protein
MLVINSMIYMEDFIATELSVRPKKNRGQVLAVLKEKFCISVFVAVVYSLINESHFTGSPICGAS